MSVAEMKYSAIKQLTDLESEEAVKSVLAYLDRMTQLTAKSDDSKIDSIFNEAVKQYGNTLKRLAQ